MTFTEVDFLSGGVRCSAWHFRAESDRLTGRAGRPVVVLAHGFGGTKDSGLAPFAECFAAAGADAFAFDYRGFGASDGVPRQTISLKRQEQDYGAAIDAATRLPGVDPQRVVIWGSSMSGSHVFHVGADRADVAAVIAMTPLTSGLAAGRAAVAQTGVRKALSVTAAGVSSRVAQARGGAQKFIPVVSRPGEGGALALEGAYESYTAMAGPTWRNEIDSSVGFELGTIRATPAAKRLRARLLVQIADFDRYVPAHAVAKTAEAGRAEVHHYPCDHFDVWPGHDWFEKASGDQVAFLNRVFAAAATTADTARPPQRA
jgi:uncharacterized protein